MLDSIQNTVNFVFEITSVNNQGEIIEHGFCRVRSTSKNKAQSLINTSLTLEYDIAVRSCISKKSTDFPERKSAECVGIVL